MLIRFRNINYPLSAEKVDPVNFAAIYGDGVKFVSARLKLTNDPISTVPSNWPAWLRSLHEDQLSPGYIGGGMLSASAPYALQAYDFKGDTNDSSP